MKIYEDDKMFMLTWLLCIGLPMCALLVCLDVHVLTLARLAAEGKTAE